MDDSVSTINVKSDFATAFQVLTLIMNAPQLKKNGNVVCVGGLNAHAVHIAERFTHARVNQLLFLNGAILKSHHISFSPLAPLLEDMLFEYKCMAIGLHVLKARWLVFWAGKNDNKGGMDSLNTHLRDGEPTEVNLWYSHVFIIIIYWLMLQSSAYLLRIFVL